MLAHWAFRDNAESGCRVPQAARSLAGAAVLFNGIRVGEVTGLGVAADNP
jgi:hypothetical protein